MKEFAVYRRHGLAVESGLGCELTSTDGRRYLDMYGGHAVSSMGYGYSGIANAVAEQACKLVFQSNSVDLPLRGEVCELLADVAPPGLDSVLFLNSGAEANENALRMACRLTGRRTVVALKGAFHGRTAACAAVTDGSEHWNGFPNRPFEVDWIAPNDLASLEAITSDTAGVIFEPVQGVGGAVAMEEEFLRAIRRRCDETGALMIADEVQTGAGRTGTFFCMEQSGIVPDILTCAKGLAGGFPIAIVLAKSEIADKFGIGSLGTTFGGGPMALAAAKVVIQTVMRPEFLAQVRSMSDRLMSEAVLGPFHAVSGRGLLIGLHSHRPAADILADYRERGVIAGDSKNPNVVRLLPPLILGDEEVDRFISITKEIPA